MVQNHLMQVLALIAMEPPIAFSAENVRDRKHDVLAVDPADARNGDDAATTACVVVRASTRPAGWRAPKCPAIARKRASTATSTTETYVALRLQLDSWRWAGVPFYLRTGKRLPKRTTEIAIQFRKPPLHIFKRISPTPIASNLLIVNVQPDEGISVRFEAKLPGTPDAARAGDDELPLRQRVRHAGARRPTRRCCSTRCSATPTLFARHDFVEASWALITPMHEAWKAAKARRRFRLTRRASGDPPKPTR